MSNDKTKEQADKAWEDNAYRHCHGSAFELSNALEVLSDYRSALKAEIERKYGRFNDEMKRGILDLIDTVVPEKHT